MNARRRIGKFNITGGNEIGASMDWTDGDFYFGLSIYMVLGDVGVVVVPYDLQLESRKYVDRDIFKEASSNGENENDQNQINRIRSAL